MSSWPLIVGVWCIIKRRRKRDGTLQSRQSTRLSLQSCELGLLHPLTRRRRVCCVPLDIYVLCAEHTLNYAWKLGMQKGQVAEQIPVYYRVENVFIAGGGGGG